MGKPRQVPMSDPRTKIVIHHTAANDLYTNIADLKAERQRRNEGYNFIIDDDDALKNPMKGHDGHAEFSQDAPDGEISNGDYGYNQLSWNVSIDGNFNIAVPTDDEINALVQVLAAKCKQWGWTKARVLGKPGDPYSSDIVGHRDIGKHFSQLEKYVTDCPGHNLYAMLPKIRERVASYLPH